MPTAAVVTPWAGEDATGRFPEVIADYPAIEAYQDITGQPSEEIKPLPNELTCKLVAPQATLDQIDADPKYEVLWMQGATPQVKDINEVPGATEKGRSREKLTDAGVPRVVAEQITAEKESLTRGQIAERRRQWQAQLKLAGTRMKAIVLAPVNLAAQTQAAYKQAVGDDQQALSVDLSPSGDPPATHKGALQIIPQDKVAAVQKAFPVSATSPVDVLILEPDNRLIWTNESGPAIDGIVSFRQFLIDENLKVIR